MKALDYGFWPFTLWNYSPENSDTWGDFWNEENLSVYCEGAPSGIEWSKRPWVKRPEVTYRNLRALPALVRPHCVLLAGEPVFQHFNVYTRKYRFAWCAGKDDLSCTTDLFVPLLHFGGGFRVLASDGVSRVWLPQEQTMRLQ
eukprot:6106428-Amphidinium_carterae.1